uniref:MKI67 FHA domain-interacting nucleolar phosphoprotein-like protein n=1 Tax=Lygus hesperus TaxID=30085 RepID=A0A0A9W4Z4_LYGHE
MAVTRKLKRSDAPKDLVKKKKTNKSPPKKSVTESSKALLQKQSGAPKDPSKKRASQRLSKQAETKSSPAIPQKKSGAPKDPANKTKIKKRLSRKSVTESSKTDQKSPKKSFKLRKSTSTDKKPKIKRRKSTIEKAVELNRGVVYFSNLPHGFYEKELRTYCTQFGVVTGVHIPRNAKNNAKGFGFVEFKFPEVAQVVADTMNNYLMFNRLIKAKIVPLEEQKPWIFLRHKNSAKLAREKKVAALTARTRILTPEEENAYKKKVEARVKRLKNKLEKQGINYDFEVPSAV